MDFILAFIILMLFLLAALVIWIIVPQWGADSWE
jgi:hypothetical protein